MLSNCGESCTVLHLIESAGGGGAETVVIQLASARPDRVHVASLRTGWLTKHLDAVGVAFSQINYHRSDLLLALQIATLARRTRADLIHCHCFTMNTVGAVGAALARVPSIATVHGVTYDLDSRKRRAAYRVAGMLHRRIVVVSSFLRKQMRDTAGIPEPKIEVIYNGVHPTADGQNGRARLRAEFGFRDSDCVVCTVGMLRSEKGHADLIEALEFALLKAPNMKLLLVGEGDGRSKLEQLVRDKGLDRAVCFAGFRDDVSRVLRASDIFALPSHVEGLSIATIEAMESGLSVVVTDSGGPPEIVSKETGFVVPPRDPVAMAGALVRLAGDTQLRQSMAASGRERALSIFSVQRMLAEYQRLYERVLSGSGRV